MSTLHRAHISNYPMQAIATIIIIIITKKINCLFPVTVLKKNRVGRSVKKKKFHYFFGQKCVYYACFTLIGSWEGGKNFRVGIFLNKNLLG